MFGQSFLQPPWQPFFLNPFQLSMDRVHWGQLVHVSKVHDQQNILLSPWPTPTRYETPHTCTFVDQLLYSSQATPKPCWATHFIQYPINIRNCIMQLTFKIDKGVLEISLTRERQSFTPFLTFKSKTISIEGSQLVPLLIDPPYWFSVQARLLSCDPRFQPFSSPTKRHLHA